MTLNIQFHSTLLLLHVLHVFASLSEYNNGFNLGVASRPMLRFVQPVQDSVVLSGQVTVNLVVHPPAFNLTELGVVFCIEDDVPNSFDTLMILDNMWYQSHDTCLESMANIFRCANTSSP